MVIFTIILGLLPSFAWLIFFLKEDIHPEPKKMIAKVFFAGAFITLLTVPLELISQDLLGFFKIGKHHLVSFLFLAVIEEAMKFFAAFITIRKSRFFDEPVDAMIYMITAALGFAAAENIFVVSANLINDFQSMEAIFGIITFRFIGATLLHALSSAVVGYYWAKSLINKNVNGQWLIVKGLILASLLHAGFNYLILSFSEILIYPTIFLIIIALFIFWDFEKIKRI